MHPAVTDFLIRMGENGVSIATNLVSGHIRSVAAKKIIESNYSNLETQRKILSKHGGGSQGLYNPILPNDINIIKKQPLNVGQFNPTLPPTLGHEPGDPFVEVPKTGDIQEMHAEKWNQYFGELYDLNDNASTGDVVKTMKSIEADINKYPCESCKENAKIHLKEMKEDNDQFTRVSTKRDGIMKLCRFKNKINEMKGSEIYPCEALVD